MAARTFAPWVEPYARQLREHRAEVLAFARALPAGAWAKPSPLEGWTCKDVLAHIGRGNDQIFQRVLRHVTATGTVDMTVFQVDTNENNARGVAERRGMSAEAVIEELDEAGEEIQELLSQLADEHQGLVQQDPPFHFEGFLRGACKEAHDLEHLVQLRQALEVSA